MRLVRWCKLTLAYTPRMRLLYILLSNGIYSYSHGTNYPSSNFLSISLISYLTCMFRPYQVLLKLLNRWPYWTRFVVRSHVDFIWRKLGYTSVLVATHVPLVISNVIVTTVLTLKWLLIATLYTFTNDTSRLLVAFTFSILHMLLEISIILTSVLFAHAACDFVSTCVSNSLTYVLSPCIDLVNGIVEFSHDFGLCSMLSRQNIIWLTAFGFGRTLPDL